MSLDPVSCSQEMHVCKCHDLYQLLLQARQLNHYLSESIAEELSVINKLTPYMPQEFLIALKKDLNNSLKLAISKESVSQMLISKINDTCDVFAGQIECGDHTVLPVSVIRELVIEENDQIVEAEESDRNEDSGKVKQKTFRRKYKRRSHPKVTDYDAAVGHSVANEYQELTAEDHQEQKEIGFEHLSEDKVKIEYKKNPKIIIKKKKINRKYKEKAAPATLRQLIRETSTPKNAYQEASDTGPTESDVESNPVQNPRPWVAPLFFNLE
ncbi:hypothetical protein E2R51_00145 [Jeotgalibacillus sp. S-D1]|uniref:hypothetical protein n=1 Tax=Jeotgalibacillus sp. S-D1 TaxID=2552189 RepID=UPI001059CBFF|nr:hypothetical protein [Jeotgalibacillus sp. S-D1]TDL34168.1 hypothetical protein E2R51_00145 [Jeotgalibacillus sp. S-D1]